MKTHQEFILETDSLILRNLKVGDITQDYVDWLNDPEINTFLSINTTQTMESSISYVKSFENRGDSRLVGIFSKDSKLHIGNITVSMIDMPNESAWVALSIGRKAYAGKGLAKEALSAIVKYYFRKRGIHSINAGISITNTRSLNLFMKCGFKIVGLIRESGVLNGKYEDGYILSVLDSEFR
jgi:[ribosomal protein S5]-alanine N-acetyltransferase